MIEHRLRRISPTSIGTWRFCRSADRDLVDAYALLDVADGGESHRVPVSNKTVEDSGVELIRLQRNHEI
jgi:hypothetical protein